ncbi:hypothetical protein [Umezawaea beigongshangensis]|uniref:hypothetical protein n=1 Tax=Umezawaea beigongshangensis TaxID=2780383 RepID=UPI0018F15EB0|nr:hypothetical protein [Umezawaea beigongshangensis]
MTRPTTDAHGSDGRALQTLQRGSRAYHCPAGHGALDVATCEDGQTGFVLVCRRCGHHLAVDTALVGAALAMTVLDDDRVPAVRLPDGSAPRGLMPDGVVRTTGWLQVARRPISSGVWAVLVGFFAGLPLVSSPGTAWLPLLTPVVAWGLWKLWTIRLRPASKAVNTGLVPAAHLVAGDLVRLYGSAGPVGVVGAVGADAAGGVRLRLVGGQEFYRQPSDRLWSVSLRT